MYAIHTVETRHALSLHCVMMGVAVETTHALSLHYAMIYKYLAMIYLWIFQFFGFRFPLFRFSFVFIKKFIIFPIFRIVCYIIKNAFVFCRIADNVIVESFLPSKFISQTPCMFCYRRFV